MRARPLAFDTSDPCNGGWRHEREPRLPSTCFSRVATNDRFYANVDGRDAALAISFDSFRRAPALIDGQLARFC